MTPILWIIGSNVPVFCGCTRGSHLWVVVILAKGLDKSATGVLIQAKAAAGRNPMTTNV
jgi:hypothetical protein